MAFEQRNLPSLPSIKWLLLKAAVKRSRYLQQKPDISLLPKTEFCVSQIQLCYPHIMKYHKVVVWDEQSNVVHPCYLHILAFPLHIKLMLLPDFPFAVVGLVHINNQISQFRPIKVEDVLNLRSRFSHVERHPKGWIYKIFTEYYSENSLVWSSESTYLVSTNKSKSTANQARYARQLEFMSPLVSRLLNSPLGREYARVSADFNPIHLTSLTAKLFGFKRHIAHGMWTKAYSVSMLGQLTNVDLNLGFKINVGFKQPIFLPSTIDLLCQDSKGKSLMGKHHFCAQAARKGRVPSDEQPKVHLVGDIQFI